MYLGRRLEKTRTPGIYKRDNRYIVIWRHCGRSRGPVSRPPPRHLQGGPKSPLFASGAGTELLLGNVYRRVLAPAAISVGFKA